MLSQRLHVYKTDVNMNNRSFSPADVPYTIDNGPGSTGDVCLTFPQAKNVCTSNKDKFQIARRNTIKALLMVGLCFIICWSNNQIYYLMYYLGYDVNWNGTYYHFTILMVFLSCMMNPFIYLIKYEDYQVALKRFLQR